MRKDSRKSNLRLAWRVFLALVIAGLFLMDFVAIYSHGTKKTDLTPKQESLWEESQENSDVLDMSKIPKKYLIRSI